MDAALAYRTHNAFGLARPLTFPQHGPRNVDLVPDVNPLASRTTPGRSRT